MASLQFPLLWKDASSPPLFPLLRKAASPPLALYDGVTPAYPEPSSHDASIVAWVFNYHSTLLTNEHYLI